MKKVYISIILIDLLFIFVPLFLKYDPCTFSKYPKTLLSLVTEVTSSVILLSRPTCMIPRSKWGIILVVNNLLVDVSLQIQ